MQVRHALFGLVLCLCAHPAWSLSWGSCTYETNEYTFTPPSGVQLSIDPDLAVGTVLYSMNYSLPNGSGAISCGNPNTYTESRGFIFGSGGSTAASMSGNGLSNGPYPVFKTSVEGIGVVFRDGYMALPHFNYVINRTNATTFTRWLGIGFSMELIKYGPITPGVSTVSINSAHIPKIEFVYDVSASMNTTQIPNGSIPLARTTIASATFSVINATCNTPDVAVDLGTRKISDTANQSGGQFVTSWVDSSIRLTGCPQFHGIGARALNATTRNNIMTITLIPNNATTNNQGIMPVDNVAGAAAGVGIQMAWGTSALPQFVDFASGKGTNTYTMFSTQGSTYTIPLVARYMQTAASISGVTAGKANGKVTYLMSYH